MSNLLKETLVMLKEHEKTESDVVWCGSTEFGAFSWDRFKELADKNYDAGYGSPKVCEDLLVVGKDWWLERHEYDGSEWWEFKAMPRKPQEVDVDVIVDNKFMWVGLKEVNPRKS